MSTFKRCKVVMLSTEKASLLYKQGRELYLKDERFIKDSFWENRTPQHLYILSDEEIKEGDWMLSHSNVVCQAANSTLVNCVSIENTKCRKIIATTDSS